MMKKFLQLALSLLFLLLFITCEKDTELVDDQTENYESSITDANTANADDHEETSDYEWDNSDVVQIVLNGSTISVDGTGATVSGSLVTITAAGQYIITGTLDNGQIIVNTEDEETVKLMLSGIDIYCSSSAPINIKNAKKVVIALAENTENKLTDGTSYTYDDADSEEPNATLFSKSDLTIYGTGSLTIDANFNDGISSKDGVIIAGGTIAVTSADDGIRGKDYLIIKDGDISVISGGDGLKSDNDGDDTKGYISIVTGEFAITSGTDALSAQTDLLIQDGTFDLKSGGGSSYTVNSTSSAKGLKGLVNVIVETGTFTINAADDAIHSDGSITIAGGTYSIYTADDGVHADATLTVNGGDMVISKCYEGLESASITVNSGNIHLTASDDGLNAANGTGNSGMQPGFGGGGATSSGNCYLYINGGYIVATTAGDGIDINGSVEMTGGTLIIDGPTSNGNGPLDYDGSFVLTGGIIVASGSSGMAQAPGTSSSVNSVLVNFSSTQQGNTLFHIQTSDGDEMLTYAPTKKYQSVVFSSSSLMKGSSYDIYLGGTSTGTAVDGIYQNGEYTPGNKYTSFTISSVVTKISSSSNSRP